jgi:hypothetical protein
VLFGTFGRRILNNKKALKLKFGATKSIIKFKKII